MYNRRLEIITEGSHYAIIDRGNELKEIAVVHNLNAEKNGWDATTSYWGYEEHDSISKAEALSKACELFLYLEKENYIHRSRLEELATKFKDGLMEDDPMSALEYFTNECEMEKCELEYFGIEDNGK